MTSWPERDILIDMNEAVEKTNWKKPRWSILAGAAFLCLLAIMVLRVRGGSPRAPDVFPREPIETLSLASDEVPSGYALLDKHEVLTTMGMAENPDYICNPTELESTTRRGGLATFLAVYGHDEEARILLNGVVFKNREKFDEFVKFQKREK